MASDNRSKWWLEPIKSEKEKWIDSSIIRRNRTKIFVYPFSGQGYFENIPIRTTTIQTISQIETNTHSDNYVILPGSPSMDTHTHTHSETQFVKN